MPGRASREGRPTGWAEWVLRSATADDRPFLFDMLVQAVNWSPDRHMTAEQVSEHPVVSGYVEGWPRGDESGVVAGADGMPIGAAWLRFFSKDSHGYGYISDDVPELSVAVVTEWRGRGVGRGLLREIAERARSGAIRAISLSVAVGNPARGLYESEGYRVVGQHGGSDIMVKRLTADSPRRERDQEQQTGRSTDEPTTDHRNSR